MKIVRFKMGKSIKHGLLDEDSVIELRGNIYSMFRQTVIKHPLSDVEIVCPVHPNQIWGPKYNLVSENEGYVVKEYGMDPWLKGSNSICGPNEPVIIEHDLFNEIGVTTSLVAVIGKQCKKIAFFFARDINFESILKFLKLFIFFILFPLSFKETTLSENITSEFLTAFLASSKILIFFLFFFTQSIIDFLGLYFLGHPIFKLNENLTEATIKLFKTLLESPIQLIFNLDIGFFLISSTVKTSDKTCVACELGLNPLIIGIDKCFLNSSNF